MTRTGLKPEWLLNLCKGKSPGVILIDGDNEKTPCFDFACEIRETMLELGAAKRLCVWSCQAFPRMNGRILMGDSTVDTHCWTITRDVDNLPPSLKPLAGALPPLMVWGAPGLGKSSILRDAARARGIGFIDVRLAQREPVDIRGLPVPGPDGERVFMDIAFCAKLSADERLFVLAHETWHCVLLHMLRCQTRDPRAFNVATDMEVNRMLAKEGLKTPDWCLMPKREWEGLSAEEIYERVRKRPKTPPEAQEGKDGHGGTDFRPPFGYVAEHPELEPSCLIYITDGCGPAPDRPPPYPVLWVLTADGEKPAPWGMELRLKPGGGEYIN